MADLQNRIERVVADATADQPGIAEVTYGGFASEGYDIPDDHPLITTLAGAFARQAGAPPALVSTTGTTDAGIFGQRGRHPRRVFRSLRGAGARGRRTGVPSVRGADGAGAWAS